MLDFHGRQDIRIEVGAQLQLDGEGVLLAEDNIVVVDVPGHVGDLVRIRVNFSVDLGRKVREDLGAEKIDVVIRLSRVLAGPVLLACKIGVVSVGGKAFGVAEVRAKSGLWNQARKKNEGKGG